MKFKKMMYLLLCLTGTMTFLNAQEAPKSAATIEDGFEKFPECRVYNVSTRNAELKELYEKIDSLSSAAAFYDKDGVKFNLKQAQAGKDVQYNMIVWDGCVRIKTAGTYTFLFTWEVPSGRTIGSIALQVKDQKALAGPKSGSFAERTNQGQFDVDLKAGMNKFRLCVLMGGNIPALKADSNPVIRFKPRNAIGEARVFKPAELFHKVQEEDW